MSIWGEDFDPPPGSPPDGEEWLTEYYEDDYPQSEMEAEEMEAAARAYAEAAGSGDTFADILEHCIQPTVTSGLEHIGLTMFYCFAFRFATQTGLMSPQLSHLTSLATGLVALWQYFYTDVAYMLILSLLSYATIWATSKWTKGMMGPFVTAACLTFNTTCELFVAHPQDWHKIRGAQMILTMKAISLAMDVDSAHEEEKARKKDEDEKVDQDGGVAPPRRRQRGDKRSRSHHPDGGDADDNATIRLSSPPGMMAFMGYAFCPGNCVFGPWIKYEEYEDAIISPVWNLTWLIKVILSMVYGFMFLTISTCWNPWMIPDGVWIWWAAYRDAMSFRASHYFVSYISEATATAAGLGGTGDRRGDWSGIQVAHPHDVEIPRSLKEVAKAWSRPWHLFLKDYCFKKVLPLGPGIATMTTFAASVMLHGLNFQLGAVLLSLGFFAYAEHELRRKLSVMFDASLGSSRSTECRHTEWELPVALFNLGCGMLVVLNLAYLGVMFNQEGIMEEGYSWEHTISKWQDLGFVPHIIMFFIFLLGKLI